jgi:hypothetical protein
MSSMHTGRCLPPVVLPVVSYERKQHKGREIGKTGVFLQTVILNELRVLLAGNRQYTASVGALSGASSVCAPAPVCFTSHHPRSSQYTLNWVVVQTVPPTIEGGISYST